MSNVCDGFIQIFDIGDSFFIAFEDSEQILQKYRLICSSFYHSKCAEDSNVLPFLPVILFSEQVQVLVENGFAQICRVSDLIEGIESFSDNGKIDKYEPNKEKGGENLLSLAQKILIGRNLKKRKRALFGTDAPSNLLKIRKIDHLNENNNNNEKAANSNEIESCENEEELQLIINELRLRNVEKEMNSKRNLNSYGILINQNNFYIFISCLPSTLYNLPDDLLVPQNAEYFIRLTVFRDLWRKGFYLLSGAKFGCDYLAYEKPPGEQHSLFMVICSDVNKSLNLYNLIATSRVSTQVKKKILFAVVSPGTLLPYYLEMNWWKGDGNLMLFFSFFKSLVGREVIIELKNDLSICGTLHSVDQYLNVKVTDINVTDVERHPHMISVKNCFIRGSVIRYVHLPSDGIDTQLLQEATRKEVLQSRQQGTSNK
uniref:U6 snRNA-associated Sm-like protein LSm2 n=3 Tax=Meloidogyne TaxID=189290 RepID=A0A914M194_MELIC